MTRELIAFGRVTMQAIVLLFLLPQVIAVLRALVAPAGIMDDAAAQAVRTKQELFDAVMRDCPFC